MEPVNSILAPYSTTCLFDRDGNLNEQDLLDKLNEADFQFVINAGHGNPQETLRYLNWQVFDQKVRNTKYYLIYDSACYAGAFDNRNESGGYGKDSIGEQLVKGKHGAFAFIGDSRYGWGFVEVQHYTEGFFDTLCNERISNIGRTLQHAKETCAGLVPTWGLYRWIYYDLNLLGDPETSLASDFVTPCADISEPDGSSPVRDEDSIIIKGTATRSSNPNATFRNYTIEYGEGTNPIAWYTEKVTLVDDGNSEIKSDVLGEWDASGLDKGRYTIRLKVFDSDGNFTDDKQIVSLCWPKAIERAVYMPVTAADIDDDASQEIFVGAWRWFHAFYYDGSELPGWPQTFSPYGQLWAAFAVGDLNNDGCKEILNVGGGREFVWNVDGSYFDGDGDGIADWPRERGSEVALANLDDDDALEIVFGNGNLLFALNGDGSDVDADRDGIADWPVEIGDAISTGAAIGDIDGDGSPDVVVGANNGVYALSNTGVILDGWPYAAGHAIVSSPAMADFDDNGELEIVFIADGGYLYCLNHDGSLLAGWPIHIGVDWYRSAPSIGDVDGDGDPEIAVGTHSAAVFVFHHDGGLLAGWPVSTSGMMSCSPAIGDIDGDGDREVLAGSRDHKVYAWHHDGTLVSGWPKQMGSQLRISSDVSPEAPSPCIADIDGDGLVEVVVGSDDFHVHVYETKAPYLPENVDWGMYRHDERHTGLYTPHRAIDPRTLNRRTLDISSNSGGSVTTPGEGSFQFVDGSLVMIKAVPDKYWYFVGWTGTGVDARKVADPNAASTKVIVDADYTLQANFAKEVPVYFPDSNLKAAIEATLGVSNPMPTDMRRLTVLSVYNKRVTDLTGIEYATKMTLLSIDKTTIRDISALSGLCGLQSLRLPRNQITDISALSRLSSLRDLDLQSNQISDISALAGLRNLWSLVLTNNRISDISALSTQTNLQILRLGGNQITDISALSGLSGLLTLELQNNQITDISALSGLSGLPDLELQNNQISDISALGRLTGLSLLWLSNNRISDVSVLSELTNLTDVLLNGNQISDISALARLTKLASLDLRYNPLNGDAYRTYLPQIQKNNPKITLWYDPLRYTLTVSFTSGGSVTAPGAGSFRYDPGTVVPIRATADTNRHFVKWTGTAVDAGKVADPYSANTTVTMDADYTLQANFTWVAVKVVARPEPSDCTATTIPEHWPTYHERETFYLELWAQVSHPPAGSSGLSCVFADVAFDSDIVSAKSVESCGSFATFSSGTIKDDLIDELGGCTLTAGLAIAPQGALIARVRMIAYAQGQTDISLSGADTACSVIGYGRILSEQIALESCQVTVGTIPETCIYDLDGDGFLGPGDLSLFTCCWLRAATDSGCDGKIPCVDSDFDCDGTIGPGDLAWFATGWLNQCGDPAIKLPLCPRGSTAGRIPSVWSSRDRR